MERVTELKCTDMLTCHWSKRRNSVVPADEAVRKMMVIMWFSIYLPTQVEKEGGFRSRHSKYPTLRLKLRLARASRTDPGRDFSERRLET